MKDLRETEYANWSYEEVLASLEVEILLQTDTGDYQGDTYVLLRHGDRLGLLFFGWGSCGGCDALRACDTLSDAHALRDQLWGEVHWEDSSADMLTYINAKDWELDFFGHTKSFRDFLPKAVACLEGRI